VVELNRAAAVAMSEGPESGLELIDAIDGLEGYGPLHAARGDLLRRLDRGPEAVSAFERALELSTNPVERRFIERRIAELSAGSR
jgi:RNA polymerase sigma-70 factor (ECF subfamily)